MERATVNGIELEYESHGSGEPIILIHGVLAGAFKPLIAEPALQKYRLISYNRRGFRGSQRSADMTFRENALDCRALIRHLGIEKAHAVGHSSGALVALQLALDAPEVVHTLALLDATLPSIMFASPRVGEAVQNAIPLYQSADKRGAFDAFVRGFLQPDYADQMTRVFGPQIFEVALADLDTLFQIEFPALRGWTITQADSARISQPVLLVVGGNSFDFFQEINDLLRKWLPRSESYTLKDADHLLMIRNPRDMATALAGFVARHAIQPTATVR